MSRPWVRFYAGAALRAEGGQTLGTLCVLDQRPRALSRRQLAGLSALSRQVMAQLTLGRKAAELAAEVQARKTVAAALEVERRGQVETERRWRSLVENAPLAVLVVGADQLIHYANPQARSLCGGTTACDLVGRSALEFMVSPDDSDAERLLLGSLINGEVPVCANQPMRQLDGNVITIELNAARIDYQGQPAIQVQIRDTSAMARAEIALRESEARWRQLIAGSPVGLSLADEHGRFVTANPALCAMLGRPEADVLGQTIDEFTHPEDRSEEPFGPGEDRVLRSERRFVRADGQVRWASATIAPTPGPLDERWTIAHVQDVTERKADEQALRDSEANLSAVSRVLREIQSGADARETIVHAAVELAGASRVVLMEPNADRSAIRTSAASSASLLGLQVPLAIESVTGRVFRTGHAVFLADPPSAPDPSLGITLDVTRSAYVAPVLSGNVVTAVLGVAWENPIADLCDRQAKVITVLADHAGVALRQSALLAELESLALTDPLTALPNRRDWNRRIAMLMKIAARSRDALTVAIADLDHFKDFNDNHGHPAGDRLLCEFAVAAQNTLGVGDTVARWGGEEFALALPDCPAAEASAVLDRVRLAVPLGQTCSIGHATWDGRESADELMARADRALYAAKSSGRNLVLLAS